MLDFTVFIGGNW